MRRARLALAVAMGGLLPLAGVHPATAADPSMSVTVSDGAPTVGDTETVTVSVAGGSTTTTVSLTRTDAAGSHPVGGPQFTDASGRATFTDTPDVRGTVTWTAQSHVPDASAARTVTVAGKPASMTLDVSRRVVRAGRYVAATAHLSGPAGATVRIYAKPYHRDRRLVVRDTVDANGDLRGSFRVMRRTTFIAAYAGDATYVPASARVLVRARAHMENTLGGGYGFRDGYRLYRPRAAPRLYGHLLPEREGACVYYRAQRRYLGAWHTVELSGCVPTDADGRTLRMLEGHHVVDKPYRVRVEWHGNRALLRDSGPWLKLKFHRP